MDGAKDGVIYFSMGSYLVGSTIFSDKVRDHFVEVFRKIKQKVLWKWEAEIPAGLPPNVKISKWLPQTAILG